MKMKKEDIARAARGLGGIASHQKTADSVTNNVGNKVLPITDSSHSISSTPPKPNNIINNEQCPNILDKAKEKSSKGDHKTKTISRLKELLKWAVAANAKAEKGGKYIGRKVLLFKNRAALKAILPDNNDQLINNESPKISLKWEVERCSTTSSSVYSAISAVPSSLKHDGIHNADSINSTPLRVRDQCVVARSGNWITTDSEFVVLEL